MCRCCYINKHCLSKWISRKMFNSLSAVSISWAILAHGQYITCQFNIICCLPCSCELATINYRWRWPAVWQFPSSLEEDTSLFPRAHSPLPETHSLLHRAYWGASRSASGPSRSSIYTKGRSETGSLFPQTKAARWSCSLLDELNCFPFCASLHLESWSNLTHEAIGLLKVKHFFQEKQQQTSHQLK